MECTTRETPTTPAVDPKLFGDLKTLALFVELHCRHKHAVEGKEAINLRTHDVERIAGRRIVLCAECRRLLTHAFVKRSHCPMNPKPACKHCPSHCYHPNYRDAMREVMRYSGRKMVMGGRLDYLIHLLF